MAVMIAASPRPATSAAPETVAWSRTVPFIMMHLACLPVLWCGASKLALGL